MLFSFGWTKRCGGIFALSCLALLPVAAQSYAYIANRGDGTVSIVKADSYEVVSTLAVADSPVAVTVSPDGKRLYVVSSQPEGKLSVIDLEANSVIAILDIGLEPSAAVVHPDGSRVYIANAGSNEISVVDTTALTVLPGIAL